jgi:hypothetical protein
MSDTTRFDHRCPMCGEAVFRDGSDGYLECMGDICDSYVVADVVVKLAKSIARVHWRMRLDAALEEIDSFSYLVGGHERDDFRSTVSKLKALAVEGR